MLIMYHFTFHNLFKSRKDVSLSEVFALLNWSSVGYYKVYMFLKFRVIECEYIVKISRGVVKHVYKVLLFRFVKVRHKIPLITKYPREDAGGLSREYVLRIPSVS